MLWTEEETEILGMDISIEEMCELLPHRTRKSILNKKSRVRPTGQTQWTMDERRILQIYYTEEKENILTRLPGRTWDSVRSQVYYLRKRGWEI